MLNEIGTATAGHFGADGLNSLGETATDYAGSAEYLENVLGHAGVGCAAALANGQSCFSGAVAGGASGAAGPFYVGSGVYTGTALASITGGIGSAAGGGSFEQGAFTGALGYLYNDSFVVTPSLNAPGFLVRAINAVFGTNIMTSGGGIVFAISYPGVTGGEWDAGIGVQGILLGADAEVGTGYTAIDVGMGAGSVRDLAGTALMLGFNNGVWGMTVSGSVDENGNFTLPGSSITVHFGPGFQGQIVPTYTGMRTIRDYLKLE